MLLGNFFIAIMVDATIVNPVNTSLIVAVILVVRIALLVNTARTCPPLLLALRLLLQLIC